MAIANLSTISSVSVSSKVSRTEAAVADSEGATYTLDKLDRIGAVISFACAIHCMLLPLALTIFPTLIGLGLLASSGFEMSILGISAVLAIGSLCWGFRIHRKKRVLALLAIGLCFFTAAHSLFGGDLHAGHLSDSHGLLLAFGGVCFATGHLLNRKLCKACTGCK